MSIDRRFFTSLVTSEADFSVRSGTAPKYLNPQILFRFWRMGALWGNDLVDEDGYQWLVWDFRDSGPLCKYSDNRASGGRGGMFICPSGPGIVLSPVLLTLKNGISVLCEDVPIVNEAMMLGIVCHVESSAIRRGIWDGNDLSVYPLMTWPSAATIN